MGGRFGSARKEYDHVHMKLQDDHSSMHFAFSFVDMIVSEDPVQLLYILARTL